MMPNRSHASRSHQVATGQIEWTEATGVVASVVMITRARWFSETESRL